MKPRLRTIGRKLADLRALLEGPPRPLIVTANVPEGASAAEADAILDEAQRAAEAADPYDGPRPVLRIALEGPEPTHVFDEPEEPAERTDP